jgi:hypothetical protein
MRLAVEVLIRTSVGNAPCMPTGARLPDLFSFPSITAVATPDAITADGCRLEVRRNGASPQGLGAHLERNLS